MTELEKELFEEFKLLDAICQDMFSCSNGVSEYISQMEQTPAFTRRNVSSWEKDYLLLKRLRWLRNQIAHNTSVTECNINDVERLQDFHHRLLHQQDPLAVLWMVQQKMPRGVAAKNIHDIDVEDERDLSYKTHSRSFGTALFAAILAALFLIVFAVFYLRVM